MNKINHRLFFAIIGLALLTTEVSAQLVESIVTTKDCFTSSTNPNANWNGSLLVVQYNSANDSYEPSLVYFNHSSIPQNAQISVAYLHLYCTSNPNDITLRIGRLAEDSWTETGVTYNNMPSGTTPPSFKYFSVGNPNSWKAFNVTEFVQSWHSGTYPNNGFQLFTTSDGTGAIFSARESGSNVAPYLEVRYQVPSPPVPRLTSVTGMPSSVDVGEPFTVTLTARNDGGNAGPDAAINASVLFSDNTHDLSLSGPSGVSWADYTRNFSPGEGPLYNDNCQVISGGARDHVVEAGDNNWTLGESHSMSFTVTPQKAGTIYVRVRTTMQIGSTGCDFANDYSGSGGTVVTDQQGWTVRQYAVSVVAPSPKLVSVTGIPSTVKAGESFTVTLTARNDGGKAGPDAALNASVLYSDNTHDLTLSGPSEISWADYTRNFSPGQGPIYNNNCQVISEGASDDVVEAGDNNWTSGEAHSMSFTVTPHKAGIIYVRVRTTMQVGSTGCDFVNDYSGNGGTITTDQQEWAVRQFTVDVTIEGQIVAFNPLSTGLRSRGDTLQTILHVKNNTTSPRSFWVGLSFAHVTATSTSWPVGYYDIEPLQTAVIDPGQTETVIFTFAPHKNLQPGQYSAIARTWDRFNEVLYLMEGPLDNTLNYPQWTTPGRIGLASFSLDSFEGPTIPLLDQIEYAIQRDFFKVSTLTDLYRRQPNAQKPLLVISVGKNIGTLYGVPISAGGSLLIDLADLLNVSPEGNEWVTVWIDAEGALGYTASLIPGPVDISVIPHDFDFYERALADQRLATIEAGRVAVPGLAFTALSCDATGCNTFKLQWNGSVSISLTLIGVSKPLVSVEVNKTKLRDVFLSNPGGISSLSSLRDYLVNAFSEFTGGIRTATLDDGDWELFSHQREVPLQLSKIWNETEKPAHYFFINVPSNASQLTFQTTSGTGNADLYVKRGSRPTSINTDGYDFKAANPGNIENIWIDSPQAGRWGIMIPTNSSYSNVELLARVTTNVHVPLLTVTTPDGGDVWQQGTTHTITWSSQNNPGTSVKIDLYSNHGGTLDRVIIPSTPNSGSHDWQVPPDLMERADYRVRITSTSNSSIWDQSDASFTIITPTTQPILSVTPSRQIVGSSSVGTNISVSNTGSGSLSWNASVISESNWLTISSGSSGTNSGLVNLSYSENTDTNSRKATIRVTASEATNSPRDVTITQEGRSLNPPAAPILSLPSDGATGISTNPTLSWNLSSGATLYRLQVSTDSTFSDIVFDHGGITGASQQVSDLAGTTTYYWHVNATNADGTNDWSTIWSFTTESPTFVEQVSNETPKEFRLGQNYPNPFNPSTTIEFDLPRSSFVTLKIYNSIGEEVATLISESLHAGKYKTEFNGNSLASGLYVYRLQAGSFVQTKKMSFVK